MKIELSDDQIKIINFHLPELKKRYEPICAEFKLIEAIEEVFDHYIIREGSLIEVHLGAHWFYAIVNHVDDNAIAATTMVDKCVELKINRQSGSWRKAGGASNV
jgi:hypothetical protein